MPSLKHALLAMMMTNVRAWYQMYDFAPPRYELSWYQMYDKIAAAHAETAPSPYWSATSDAYDLKIRLPDLEPGTVEAQLSSDGKKIEVKGERKIESCSCKPTTVREIALPYRPRAEDITVTIQEDTLHVTLSRHAQADEPTPLTVKKVEAPAKETEEARPLRFVPHASATEKTASTAQDEKVLTVQEQEKTLTDKFRSAALASLAVQRENKEASNASDENATMAPSA